MISDTERLLIEQYLDDQLDEAGLQRLALALESPGCRRELELALHLRGLAAQAEPVSTAKEFSDSVIDRCAGLQTASLENKVLKNLQERAQRSVEKPAKLPFWKRTVFIIAVAAQLSIGLVLWMIYHKPEPVLIGTVLRAEDGFLFRQQQKINLQAGLQIRAGDLVQLGRGEGLIFEYPDGTNLRLNSDSSVSFDQISGAKRLHLFSGKLSLDVRPQTQGRAFEIHTEHAACVVVGTKLHISTEKQFTRLSVEKGSVEMHSLHQPGKVEVKAGESASASANAPAKINIKTDPLFLSSVVNKGSIPISVALDGAKKVYLVVDTGGDQGNCDHAVWIHPRLRSPGKPDLNLDSRPWTLAKSSWSGPLPHRNSGLFGDVAMVDAKPVKPCISVHPNSVIVYDVPPGYTSFEAEGGVLDSGFSPPAHFPSVKFSVYTEMTKEDLQKIIE